MHLFDAEQMLSLMAYTQIIGPAPAKWTQEIFLFFLRFLAQKLAARVACAVAAWLDGGAVESLQAKQWYQMMSHIRAEKPLR